MSFSLVFAKVIRDAVVYLQGAHAGKALCPKNAVQPTLTQRMSQEAARFPCRPDGITPHCGRFLSRVSSGGTFRAKVPVHGLCFIADFPIRADSTK